MIVRQHTSQHPQSPMVYNQYSFNTLTVYLCYKQEHAKSFLFNFWVQGNLDATKYLSTPDNLIQDQLSMVKWNNWP